MAVLREDVKNIIRDSVDVELLLKHLGFQISRVTSYEVRAKCKIHGGDNQTAFSMKLDTKRWRCFTKGCEKDHLGNLDNDLIALVRRTLGLSFVGALSYLAQFAGFEFDQNNLFVEPSEELLRARDNQVYIRSVNRVTARQENYATVSEDLVKSYAKNRSDYFLKSGFKPETLETFEVGSNIDNYGVKRATIPIRDSKGTLISVSGRREDSDEEPRYKLDFDFRKEKILYNLHRALQTDTSTIIVVEGFKALWAVYEAGFSNVVACMGKTLTDEQILLLCSTPFTKCLLLLDGDEAGRHGALSSQARLEKFYTVQTLTLPDEMSPDDFERYELCDLINIYLETL